MNINHLIQELSNDGIKLSFGSDGKLTATGKLSALEKWSNTIRESKELLIAFINHDLELVPAEMEIRSNQGVYDISHLAEFNKIFVYLAKRNGWKVEDHAAWLSDLQSEPENTMVCLRALRRSWDAGKYGVLDSLEGVE